MTLKLISDNLKIPRTDHPKLNQLLELFDELENSVNELEKEMNKYITYQERLEQIRESPHRLEFF